MSTSFDSSWFFREKGWEGGGSCQAEHCSVAVVLQVEDVAGLVATLLHDASLHHHLHHLVLEGELGHFILTACCSGSTRLGREET